MSLERVDDVERRDRLPLGVLCVRDGVADDAFQEGLEDAAGLFVDHCSFVSAIARAGWRVPRPVGGEQQWATYWQKYA